jgi:DNA repair exonuclease SbcCD ATPase subunit
MANNRELEELEDRIAELEDALSTRSVEEEYEGMSDEEAEKLDNILEQFETGKVRLEELSSEELKVLSNFMVPMATHIIPRFRSRSTYQREIRRLHKESSDMGGKRLKLLNRLRLWRDRYNRYCYRPLSDY